jgi:hypothetical protein
MSKYRNVKTVLDGITFASKREAMRYAELKLLAKAGKITGLECQPRFLLAVNGVKIATYVADFSYHAIGKSEYIVEDAKGMKTPIYKLKAKLMKACHGIDIVEV